MQLKSKLRMKQIRDKLGRFTSQIETAPYGILLEEAPTIEALAKMKTPYDPFDDDQHLRDSVQCEVFRDKKTIVNMTLSASAQHRGFDYAPIQHDTESFHHPSLRNQKRGVVNHGEQAYYLRDAFAEGQAVITQRLHEEIGYDR